MITTRATCLTSVIALSLLYVTQDGMNLAQWLVNKPDKVKDKLTECSEEFLDFWKGQRQLYWQQVAAAKKVFDEQQKNSDEVSSLLLTTRCGLLQGRVLCLGQQPRCCSLMRNFAWSTC
jgi:hypothetical protein